MVKYSSWKSFKMIRPQTCSWSSFYVGLEVFVDVMIPSIMHQAIVGRKY